MRAEAVASTAPATTVTRIRRRIMERIIRQRWAEPACDDGASVRRAQVERHHPRPAIEPDHHPVAIVEPQPPVRRRAARRARRSPPARGPATRAWPRASSREASLTSAKNAAARSRADSSVSAPGGRHRIGVGVPQRVRLGQRPGVDLGRGEPLERARVDLGQALVDDHRRGVPALGGRDDLAGHAGASRAASRTRGRSASPRARPRRHGPARCPRRSSGMSERVV